MPRLAAVPLFGKGPLADRPVASFGAFVPIPVTLQLCIYARFRSERLQLMDFHWSHGHDREAAMKHALLGPLNPE
jgi:hypothetical protein